MSAFHACNKQANTRSRKSCRGKNQQSQFSFSNEEEFITIFQLNLGIPRDWVPFLQKKTDASCT